MWCGVVLRSVVVVVVVVVYQSIYLSICKLETEANYSARFPQCVNQRQKRSNCARLPPSTFELDNVKNEAILKS